MRISDWSSDVCSSDLAEAVTASTVCRFSRDKLEALMQRLPKIEQRLLSIASNELVVAQEQMLLLGRKTARAKVASFLLMLLTRARQHGRSGDTVTVTMSRNALRHYLGPPTDPAPPPFTH